MDIWLYGYKDIRIYGYMDAFRDLKYYIMSWRMGVRGGAVG